MKNKLLLSNILPLLLGSEFYGPVKNKDDILPPQKDPPRNATNLFCGDCEHLTPKEKFQGRKQPHMCTKFNVQVYHFNRHPNIYKCNKCLTEI